MAQVLYWTVYLDSVADYANNATDAAKIAAGQDSTGSSLPAGQKGSQTYVSGSPTDASTPASGLSENTAYRVAWTIYDDVATTYGGGTSTYVVFSDAFTTKVSHATSGALAAQAATAAGTAAHQHVATGALAAQAATVAGTAAHPHVTTGALAAQAATVDGTAALDSSAAFSATGALAAQAATVAGTAAHLTLHTSTGALAAQAATASGTAVHPHIAVGALAAQAATVAGTAAVAADGTFTTEGAIAAGAATVAGTATHLTLHATTGAMSAQAAVVVGAAQRYALHTTTGALAAQAARVAGSAARPAGAAVATLPTWYYTPGALPLDAPPWLARELMSISRATYGAAPYLQMQVAYTAPAKPRDGMVVLAAAGVLDTNAGVYARIGGAWVQL